MSIENDDLPGLIVDAMYALGGTHPPPGQRAAHARGTVMAATFTGTPQGAGLTRAAHLQGQVVRATVRFSNNGGNPDTPDYAPQTVRGIAVKFYLQDGSTTDMLGLSLPCFNVRTPEDFLALTRAMKPDPDTGQPDPKEVDAYLSAHPEAVPAVEATLAARPPASYATVAYNGLNTFRWVNVDGAARNVRFRFEPEAGLHDLSDSQARERGDYYLQEEIAQRTGAAFRLMVAIAEEGDPLDDPTAQWPPERRTIEAGRLELAAPDPARGAGADVLAFDPTVLPDGMAVSDDPVLGIRPAAYVASVKRRTSAPR